MDGKLIMPKEQNQFIGSVDTINGRFDIFLTHDFTKYIVTSASHNIEFEFAFYSNVIAFIKMTELSIDWEEVREYVINDD